MKWSSVAPGVTYARNCEGILHSHSYAACKRVKQTCPVCDSPWNGDSEEKLKKMGESAFVEGQDKHARVRRRTDNEEEEEKEEVVYHEDRCQGEREGEGEGTRGKH